MSGKQGHDWRLLQERVKNRSSETASVEIRISAIGHSGSIQGRCVYLFFTVGGSGARPWLTPFLPHHRLLQPLRLHRGLPDPLRKRQNFFILFHIQTSVNRRLSEKNDTLRRSMVTEDRFFRLSLRPGSPSSLLRLGQQTVMERFGSGFRRRGMGDRDLHENRCGETMTGVSKYAYERRREARKPVISSLSDPDLLPLSGRSIVRRLYGVSQPAAGQGKGGRGPSFPLPAFDPESGYETWKPCGSRFPQHAAPISQGLHHVAHGRHAPIKR